MAYYKPQSPLIMNGNGIYPLTTYDQIILPDNTRWNGSSAKISIEPTITSGTKLATITIDGVSKNLYYQASSVNLNGVATTAASFYAPTSAGIAGQILLSSGEGLAPYWTNANAIWARGIADDTFANTAYVCRAATAALSVTQDSKMCWAIERTARNENSLTAHFYDENSNWTAGGKLLSELNYSNYALPLTGGKISGNIFAQKENEEVYLSVKNTTINSQIYLYANDDSAGIYGNIGENGYSIIKLMADGTTIFNGNATSATQDGDGNTISSTYLKLTGGIMTGNISIKNLNLTKGTAPSAQQTRSISFCDSTGVAAANRYGMLWSGVDSANKSEMRMYAYQSVSGSTNNAYLYVLYTADGTAKAGSSAAFYGAVWNDYAEYRNQIEEVKPGYIVYSEDDGKLRLTTKRLQKFEGVVSDTFGFAIGETDDCKTPLAVSGRVLVYTNPEEEFHTGDCVCAGPNGLACRMTREEIIEFPDRIVGVVSEIPTYETWGTGNVAVNGRIWVKVK